MALTAVGSGIIGSQGLVGQGAAAGTKQLFVAGDKENNCSGVLVGHQINSKMMSKSGAQIATLRHANTSDDVMMH